MKPLPLLFFTSDGSELQRSQSIIQTENAGNMAEFSNCATFPFQAMLIMNTVKVHTTATTTQDTGCLLLVWKPRRTQMMPEVNPDSSEVNDTMRC